MILREGKWAKNNGKMQKSLARKKALKQQIHEKRLYLPLGENSQKVIVMAAGQAQRAVDYILEGRLL